MGRSARDADSDQRSSVAQVLRIVARNPALLRVELAFATFKTGEWAMWLGMVVYAYGNGGVTESGIVATALLVPAALFAPVAAAIGDRHAPGRALLAGYVAEATSCAVVAVLAVFPRSLSDRVPRDRRAR